GCVARSQKRTRLIDMNDLYLKAYHGLPIQAKTWAAGLRGYYLRHWRYGRDSAALVDAALERERWAPGQWKEYVDERLRYVLHRAATQVPYYQRYWRERRLHGDTSSWQDLENWPILEKRTLRENPAAFVAHDCDTKRMFCEHTSGTTGTPLSIWST